MKLGEILRRKVLVQRSPAKVRKVKATYPGLSRRDWLALQVRWDH